MRGGPRVGLLTREYPPEIYGGAGVHVEYLAKELRQRLELSVHCWGEPRGEASVKAYQPWPALAEPKPEAGALQAISIDLAMVAALKEVDLVHSHTWYVNLAGHFAKLTWAVPHIVTTHSLEPLRPWKAEQLGGGYALSRFCEETGILGADAVIAVSQGMRRDVLDCYPGVDPARVRVIHNGIDPEVYHPVSDPAALRQHGVDPVKPYAIFVGRVTRQKGLQHLLAAARHLDPRTQLVVCAGAADTPELGAEVEALADQLRQRDFNLVYLEGFLPLSLILPLLTGATVFVCPSIYEPFGLVNLEAMACETAVVASAVGGIPEVVVEGETGHLVEYDKGRPEEFERGLAARLQELLQDPDRAARFGAAGRQRVLEKFSWPAIADQTVDLYEQVLTRRRSA
ncbi:MAG: glycogen synthase [Candidatus Dormibacter sp.]|uniref:glycogen synthase n=1 Tax=Candidatus Dormibacter sp. TaxID=2973982 RepID=UPI000DB07607|nr:MAG: glycogen synthase [Candidatus Dormibacteraeota bacterium]